MPDKPYEDVEIEGHLIDSLVMPKIMDGIMDLDGEFEVLSFDVGHMKDDPSPRRDADLRARREAPRGAPHRGDRARRRGRAAARRRARAGRPRRRLPGRLLLDDQPRDVRARRRRVGPCAEARDGLRDPRRRRCRGRPRPCHERRARRRALRDRPRGIRVLPLERPRESQPFEFMASAVSSEKPKAQIVHEVARLLRHVKDEGKLTIAVVGPAVVHTGAAPASRASHRGGLRQRPVRRQRRRDARHRGRPLRHVPGHRPRAGDARRGRPRAPPARHQHHPALRRHRGGRRAGRARPRSHAHARHDRDAVRPRRLHPRRRAAARGHHRRDGGAAGDARRTRSGPAPA